MTSSRSFVSRFSAAVPASCTIGGVHDSVVLIILPIASATSARRDGEAEPPAAHAVRLAERVGADALLEHARLAQQRVMAAVPDHVAVRLVAEDGDVAAANEVGDRASSRPASSRRPSGCAASSGRSRAATDRRRGTARCRRRRAGTRSPGVSGVSTARAPRRSMFGRYVGKYGLKTSTPSPGFKNASQKNCSKTLAPGPATMLLGLGRNVELLAHELGGRRAKLRHAGRRAVVRLVVLDRLHAARPRRRRAVERAVADLELDDVLAGRLQRARHREHGESRLDGQRASKITELCGHGAPLGSSDRMVGLGRARCRSNERGLRAGVEPGAA